VGSGFIQKPSKDERAAPINVQSPLAEGRSMKKATNMAARMQKGRMTAAWSDK